MQKELDKIDRFASKIVDQAQLTQSAAKKLTKEVKVVELLFTFSIEAHSTYNSLLELI